MEESLLPKNVLPKNPSRVHFHYVLEKHKANPPSRHQSAVAQPRASAYFALLPSSVPQWVCAVCNGVALASGGGH